MFIIFVNLMYLLNISLLVYEWKVGGKLFKFFFMFLDLVDFEIGELN